ncbi:MAG: dihydroneopterin aldolase [Verrucomicrobiota bacterium]
MTDQIRIQELEVRARVGVPEFERAELQRVLCSVTMIPAGETVRDDIDATVDYAAVAALVRQIADRHVFRLIETMAEEIATQIVAKFHLRSVTVEVRKFALRDAAFVSAQATKSGDSA